MFSRLPAQHDVAWAPIARESTALKNSKKLQAESSGPERIHGIEPRFDVALDSAGICLRPFVTDRIATGLPCVLESQVVCCRTNRVARWR